MGTDAGCRARAATGGAGGNMAGTGADSGNGTVLGAGRGANVVGDDGDGPCGPSALMGPDAG